MKLWLKLVLGGAGVVALAGIGLVSTALVRWDRAWDRPLPELSASTDPEVIARGKHLVEGPAHCMGCHGDVDQLDHYEETGEPIPMSGGFVFDIPPGKFRAPNITSDPATGIGDLTDAEVARALREGVDEHGRMLFAIMPFADLSDDDLVAVISYLRTVEPVEIEREPSELTLLGKILWSFVVEPVGPREPPPKTVTPAPTAEYGEYLANNVANCRGCHTERDLATGAYTGPDFGGGLELEHRGAVFMTPNITIAGEGSKLTGYTLDAFKTRIRSGEPSAQGSPMPWIPYAQMTDLELEAIWAYLQTVDAVDIDRGPAIAG